MSENFEVGARVQLRSGGRVMTVTEDASGGDLICAWVDKSTRMHGYFSPGALRRNKTRVDTSSERTHTDAYRG